MSGTLVLVGGAEWGDGCTFDAELFATVDRTLVVPTALAYEQPGPAVERARAHFEPLGVAVDVLDVFRRPQAMDPAAAEVVTAAESIYVASGSPMHLRSVLMDTPLLDALVGAWAGGALVAVAGEATSVICTDMVDSRGGAFTVGLGLIDSVAFVPRFNQWSPEKWRRTLAMAPADRAVVGIDESTALIHAGPGDWRVAGAGDVHIFVNGRQVGLDALPESLAGSTS
jgi:cyanophycinase